MTLVLSEVSKFGIVMVGDSAITTTHEENDRLPSGDHVPPYSRFGAQKVKQVPNLPIGISFYGMGRIAKIPTDLWMDDFFAHKVQQNSTLGEICNTLIENVNEAFFMNMQNDLGGFHVGAILHPGTDQAYPVLYNIFREDRQHPFRLQKDNPDGRGLTIEQYRQALNNGTAFYLRNGMHEAFSAVQNNIIDSIYQLVGRHDIQIPYPPGLAAHEKFNRLQVALMCDLISMSSKTASVGRPISSLTIDLNGRVTYSSALNNFSYA